jgi:hypothetical protein
LELPVLGSRELLEPLPVRGQFVKLMSVESLGELQVRRARRFHDDFVDLMLAQPVGQEAQLRGRAPELAPLERVLPVGGEIGDDHG